MWELTDNILLYQHQHFEFKGNLVIIEFEGFLIKKMRKSDYLSKKIEINNVNKVIKKLAKDNDIVIIHNYTNNNKILIDMIKTCLEEYVLRTNLILLALFPLKPNNLSKPYTGSWSFLNSYYKNIGKVNINNVKIFNDKFFHNNCSLISDIKFIYEEINPETCEIKTFDDSIKSTENKYTESKTTETASDVKKNVLSILSIEERKRYIEELSLKKNTNWFKRLTGNNCIIIYGAPRSGKTTITNQIVRIWQNTELNSTSEIIVLNGKYQRNIKDAEKYLKERISIILDCNLYNNKLREPFIEIANKYSASVLLIEINIPIEIAYLFNKVSVQQTNNTVLPDKDFIIYKGFYQKDNDAVLYTPNINKSIELMEFQYYEN